MSIKKGYEGPEFPAHTKAVIESGVYADIESCDGMKLGSFQNKGYARDVPNFPHLSNNTYSICRLGYYK